MMVPRVHGKGFTLIELSIVLVIIGLITSGVLIGRDLIAAAGVRATLTQIEKYNSAVHTFQSKYSNQLPGDIQNPYASQFGFEPRGIYEGQGDGNGVLEGQGQPTDGSYPGGDIESSGETVAFWVDLTTAGLIEDRFIGSANTSAPGPITGTGIAQYFPAAKLGRGNYIYVFSDGQVPGLFQALYHRNYFAISAITGVNVPPWGWRISSSPGFTVEEAYNIDKKIDDGYPTSGRVLAMDLNVGLGFAGAAWMNGNFYGYPPNLTANKPSANSCYDNGNQSNVTNNYSISQNGGTGINCALSFQFQ